MKQVKCAALVVAAIGVLPFSLAAQTPEPRVAAAAALPSVELPPELERVLRDYERHWRAGDENALAALFTEDGVIRRGGWIRGRDAIRRAYERSSGELRLRAVAYASEGRVGYIQGAYGFGTGASAPDAGVFILTLRRGPDGRWLITGDLDNSLRPD